MSTKIELYQEVVRELEEVVEKLPWYMVLTKAVVLIAAIASIVGAVMATGITAGVMWGLIIAAIIGVMATLYWIFDQIQDDSFELGRIKQKKIEIDRLASTPPSSETG